MTNSAEDLVVRELEKFQLRCERFSKDERRNRKTPDYRVYKDDTLAFFCEVKEIEKDTWLNGVRADPIFNRIADDVHTAVKQFDAVNSALDYPNVMALVNNDDTCGCLDLIGVITGHLLIDNGKSAPIYQKYSEGRIKDDKSRIHLYLWFDAFKENKFLFNAGDIRQRDKLCEYFGINREDIKLISV
ncbi:MAG: hypothetical protein WA104_03120 [Thermodesulfovibrionales bacterium]